MVKLIGSILILAGCMGALVCWEQRYKRRQRLAGDFIRMCARWEYSLHMEHMRLFEFLEHYETGEPQLDAFFRELLNELKKRQYPDGSRAWKETLAKYRRLFEPDADLWDILWSADGIFFSVTTQESVRCAKVCRKRLEEYLTQASAEYLRKHKVYVPACMLGGAMIIILLI